MPSLIEDKIKAHLNSYNLNIGSQRYRFMDQKVTPDVLAFIADCILNLPDDKKSGFTKNDIWRSEYFSKNVVMIYNKPQSDNETTQHEYDKFTAQPLKSLAWAKILDEQKRGRENVYTISNAEILTYISLSDRNAFNFLRIYLEKTLGDSGFYPRIEEYINKYRNGDFSASTFSDLKSAFDRFVIGNTEINGLTEVHRIFPKVLNIFAVANGTPGARRGHVSDGPYMYSDLMYNSVNFRDLNKLKNVSRQESSQVIQSVQEYSDYEMRKAMQAVKHRHYPNSEVRDRMAAGEATQVHHIFSQSTHPNMRSVLENLILLTPQQHNTLAHPSNRTNSTDTNYQVVCLLSKLETVKSSVSAGDGFYSKAGLIGVINEGLQVGLAIDSSFEAISLALRQRQQS